MNNDNPTKLPGVLLVDDHPLVRDGLRAHLTASGRMAVVGEAQNGEEALVLALRLNPEVVMTDIRMSPMNGIELTRRLKVEAPHIRTVLLSMHSDHEYVMAAIEAGACGFMLKDAPATQIIAALETVLAGNTCFGVSVSAAMAGAEDGLTEREQQVLIMLAKGDSNKQIAQKLAISPRTVETHRLSLRRKLDIASTAGLAKYALERGWIS